MEVLVKTYAGTGSNRSVDGPLRLANLGAPTGMYCQGEEVYICDYYGNSLRKLDILSETISTVAGNGHETGPYEGDCRSVALPAPRYVFPDGTGGWLITSYLHSQIMRLKDGHMTAVAGSSTQSGFRNGPAAQALFDYPRGGCSDERSGSIYITDYGNHRIRIISASGEVSSIGSGEKGCRDGSSQEATFNGPLDLCAGPNQTFYICELGALRFIDATSHEVTTYAGTETCGFLDGPRKDARFSGLTAIAWRKDVIFLADFNNHAIRRISATGMVTTLAGSIKGFQDGASAHFSFPWGLSLTSKGHLLISDSSNNRIRIINSVTEPIEEQNIHPNECSFQALGEVLPPMNISISDTTASNKNESISLFAPYIYPLKLHPAIAYVAYPTILLHLEGIAAEKPSNTSLLTSFLYDNALPEDCTAEQIVYLVKLFHEWQLPADLLPIIYYELSCRLPRLSTDKCIALVSFIHETCQSDSYLLDLALASLQPRTSAPEVPILCQPLLSVDSAFAVQIMTRLLNPQKIMLPDAPSDSFIGSFILQRLTVLFWTTIADDAFQTSSFASQSSETMDIPELQPNFLIIADDGGHVMAHDWVLYARWPFFRHLTSSGCSEVTDRKIELPPDTLNSQLLMKLLHYLYTHSTDAFDEDSDKMQFLRVAPQFHLVDMGRPATPDLHFVRLIKHCRKALDATYAPNTCVTTYRVLAELGSPAQLASIGQYILDNFSTLMKDDKIASELKELGSKAIGEMWLRAKRTDLTDWQ